MGRLVLGRTEREARADTLRRRDVRGPLAVVRAERLGIRMVADLTFGRNYRPRRVGLAKYTFGGVDRGQPQMG